MIFGITLLIFVGLFALVVIFGDVDLRFKTSPWPGLLAGIAMAAILYLKINRDRAARGQRHNATGVKLYLLLQTAAGLLLIAGTTYGFLR